MTADLFLCDVPGHRVSQFGPAWAPGHPMSRTRVHKLGTRVTGEGAVSVWVPGDDPNFENLTRCHPRR